MISAKIVIVEDEVLVALDLQNNLQQLGYHIASIFPDGQLALDYLEEETVDLVLMDIYLMGDLDGIDTAEKIKKRFNIPVIFLTAFADSEVIHRARKVGAYGYLLKPFRIRELEAMLEVALFNHSALLTQSVVEKRMQKAHKHESLRIMAGGVAHKCTTIHTVLGDLAQDKLQCESLVKEDLLRAEKATKQAAELCGQLLAFSGHASVEGEELDLNSFVEQSKSMLETILPSTLVLDLELTDDLPHILADLGHLKQIIIALVTNSIEAYEGTSGKIVIRTSVIECNMDYLIPLQLGKKLSIGKYVCMDVCDEGIGMSSDEIQKALDPFFSSKFYGRGLGLSASLGLAQTHNGTIKITSEPGHGTTVRVLIPACNTTQDTVRMPGTSPSGQSNGSILLLDDDKDVQLVTKAMLERFGFKVFSASNESEASDILDSHSDEISCILLDYMIPGMRGHELFQEFRREWPNVKVILCSEHSEEEATRDLKEGTLGGYLQKPFGFTRLIAAVCKVLFPEITEK
ncbi:MAG: response regulator [Candidatus Sabulitectum sp.]|nr:response regulator [Candidatus Sabulitectum sp.]